jgi:putative transposase
MKYAFIRSNAGSYPVNHLCRLLGVERSAYYSWRSRPAKIVGPEELALRRCMRTLFAASRGSLGSRMMTANLRVEGFTVGRERVRHLMKALELKVKQKRQYQITTDSRHDYPVAENILNRAFSPKAPNQVWGTDITYLWTQEGWVYLAVVIDLYSRRVVGWAMDRRMKQALVIRALMMAINFRNRRVGYCITRIAVASTRATHTKDC